MPGHGSWPPACPDYKERDRRGRGYDPPVPIYEFECGSCGARFERLAAAGTETATCPECGAEGAERRISTFGVTTRQLTPAQRRRLEDKRGIDRDGARSRWKQTLERARSSRPGTAPDKKRGGGG
jgi:putative FmdB family regulatory protein